LPSFPSSSRYRLCLHRLRQARHALGARTRRRHPSPGRTVGAGRAWFRRGRPRATGRAAGRHVETSFGPSTLRLWPFTGASSTHADGPGEPPVRRHADPVAIRDALLSLDGNRTAAGFPPVYPFDATWSDAIGDAQTNWVEEEGWTGSSIQLQLGVYEPLRVHLRLFRTGAPFGDGGTWTVGAAHFEVMIPGTADPRSSAGSWPSRSSSPIWRAADCSIRRRR
jgi:hypothetical protein